MQYQYDERLELEVNENINPLYTLNLVENEGYTIPIYRGNYQEDLVAVLDKYVARKMRQQYDANTQMFKDINKILEEVKEADK